MRLHRPYIPRETRLRVALRQLGEFWPEDRIVLARKRGEVGLALRLCLGQLAELLGCAVEDLDLDHDPPLGAREKRFTRSEPCGYVYVPGANDPEFLFYRVRVAHKIKTNVRGEHGQHPDRVLIKKNRRLERGPLKKTSNLSNGRKLRSANRWPPKGSRKLHGRKFKDRMVPPHV